MKLIVAATRSNDPEVHRFGCADVKRGLANGKYQDATVIEAEEVEDGARWFGPTSCPAAAPTASLSPP